VHIIRHEAFEGEAPIIPNLLHDENSLEKVSSCSVDSSDDPYNFCLFSDFAVTRGRG
jgi:hypothetical protein